MWLTSHLFRKIAYILLLQLFKYLVFELIELASQLLVVIKVPASLNFTVNLFAKISISKNDVVIFLFKDGVIKGYRKFLLDGTLNEGCWGEKVCTFGFFKMDD